MGLANNSMTDEQRKQLSPDSEEYRLRVGGSKVQVAGWSLYTLLLWLLKTCMAIFYSRLTWVFILSHLFRYLLLMYILLSSAGLVNMRIRIHIAYVLIAVTYIATICSILFGCHPMEKNWQIDPNPGSTSYFIDLLLWETVPLTIARLLSACRVQDRHLCDCGT